MEKIFLKSSENFSDFEIANWKQIIRRAAIILKNLDQRLIVLILV